MSRTSYSVNASHLYVSHPDGTGLRQVTNDMAADRAPRWSPDGSPSPLEATSWSADGERLAGMLFPGHGIVTYSLRSHKYERLTDFGEWLAWFPDNRHVLFVADGKAFFVVDTRSKQVRKIFSVTRDVIGPPRLTRDGTKAYFSRRVTESDIWLLTIK